MLHMFSYKIYGKIVNVTKHHTTKVYWNSM